MRYYTVWYVFSYSEICKKTMVQQQITKVAEKRRHLPFCGFCRKNGESSKIYLSHTIRDSNGILLCPALLKYRCPRCRKTGHTTSYCPFNK